jgi:hypothetical protein
LLAVAAACASCTTTTRVDKDATVSQDESIFVVGSSPEHFRLWFMRADIIEKDGTATVKQDVVGIPLLVANPENGFLVGRVRGGYTIAITGVRAVRASETFGPGFSACGGNRTMVFTAPAGKVVYVGHAELSMKGKQIFASYSTDFEAARKHVDANYPNLRGKLERHGHQLITTAPCPTPQTLTIQLPAGR